MKLRYPDRIRRVLEASLIMVGYPMPKVLVPPRGLPCLMRLSGKYQTFTSFRDFLFQLQLTGIPPQEVERWVSIISEGLPIAAAEELQWFITSDLEELGK